MEKNITAVNEALTELELIYTFEEIAPEFDKEYKKQIKKVTLPGFRPGKAPLKIIEQRYGEALQYEVAEKVANEKFFDYAEAENIKIYGQPSMIAFDFKPKEELKFKIRYEHVPVFELKQYKDITVEIQDLIVTDEQVNREFQRVLEEGATPEAADTVENEQFLVDVMLHRGNPEEGDPNEPFPMTVRLFQEGVNKDLKASLMNKVVGDEFEFSFTDSHKHKKEDGTEEDHTTSLVYKGTIQKIQRMVYPELTEEYVKKISHNRAATEQEFKEVIRKDMETYYTEKMEEEAEYALDDKLIELNPFTLPPSFVERVHKNMVEKRDKELKQSGKNYPKEYLEKTLREPSERVARLYYIHDKVRELENIEVNNEIIAEHARKNAERIGFPAEQLTELYLNDENIKDNILRKELSKHLISLNTVVKVEKKHDTHSHEGHDHEGHNHE